MKSLGRLAELKEKLRELLAQSRKDTNCPENDPGYRLTLEGVIVTTEWSSDPSKKTDPGKSEFWEHHADFMAEDGRVLLQTGDSAGRSLKNEGFYQVEEASKEFLQTLAAEVAKKL